MVKDEACVLWIMGGCRRKREVTYPVEEDKLKGADFVPQTYFFPQMSLATALWLGNTKSHNFVL